MARIYKTARGQMIDIDQVKLANESVIAVGNMRVNARGDAIGPGGKVAAGRNQIMDQVYAVPSGGYSPNDPANYTEQQNIIEASSAQDLANLANNLVVNKPVDDQPAAVVPEARGSLASSVAKTTTVVQEPIVDPRIKKPTGPSRI
jgi:hypothetical protein